MKEDMIARLKAKKGESKMSPEYKDAKKSMLTSLIKHMSGMAGEPLKKVSVMSNTEHGLTHGLDKAKEILAKKEDELSEDPREEAGESPDQEKQEEDAGEEYGDMDDHEMADGPDLQAGDHLHEAGAMGGHDEADIDRQIEELMKKKASRGKR